SETRRKEPGRRGRPSARRRRHDRARLTLLASASPLARHNPTMRVSAKVDYALSACAELAGAGEGPVKGDRLAQAQEIPLKFLENILLDLRHAGLVHSQRGAEGGYWLARPAADVSLADVIRAVEGPIANVRGVRPEQVEYEGAAEALRDGWVALRASMRCVLEEVPVERRRVQQLAAGRAAKPPSLSRGQVERGDPAPAAGGHVVDEQVARQRWSADLRRPARRGRGTRPRQVVERLDDEPGRAV